MKVCSKCHIEKDESEFYKDFRVKCGLSSFCKKCRVVVNRISFEKRGSAAIAARKKSYKKWYDKNVGREKDRKNKWVNENYEHYKAIRRDWAKRNKHKALPYIKEYQDRARKELSDHHIKRILRIKYGIVASNAPPDLIELQRNILKIKRETWNRQNKQLQQM